MACSMQLFFDKCLLLFFQKECPHEDHSYDDSCTIGEEESQLEVEQMDNQLAAGGYGR
jgi:hypothetical protein